MKNPSTIRLASALIVGQNPINHERKTKRSYSPRKEQIAPPSPKPETKSQHEASRLKLQVQLEAERFKSSNATIHVCTYNARTLRTDDDTSRLVEELGKIKWHVVGWIM